GNVRQVQRLSDDDVLALCKCLQHNKCVTGELVDSRQLIQTRSEFIYSWIFIPFNVAPTFLMWKPRPCLSFSLQGNSTLLSLRLSGNKIGRGGGLELASMLQENCALQELEVVDCDLVDGLHSIIALIIMLKKNKALCSVDISRPLLFSHQEEWAVHCSKMLAVNSSLMELHLGRMGMTDTGIEQLTEGLGRNHSLRYLDLCSNRVTRDGAFHLAMMLTQNRALEILDLSSNQIGDGGAGYLSKELISSGRLHPEQTDVSPYEVDGHVFLAEVFQSLRKPYLIYVPTFTYGYKLWVLTKTMTSHIKQ
uniref:Leucine rich repeat containing 34 n=1 Tax=Pundamilia nyererei TaxID=303518 RepID=A0A3B4EWH2_9CICH